MLYKLNGISPDIDPMSWVAPGSYLIGKVSVMEAASIWFGVTLRGDNERITIGIGSNVQENCVLHTDIGFPLVVGTNCTIGHKALLHGCTIGNNTLIGMGAMVLNGAVIGNNCLIGAGALITEGKVIPDGSLVMGIGKIVRNLDAEAVQRLTTSALHYQQNAEQYRTGLKKIPL